MTKAFRAFSSCTRDITPFLAKVNQTKWIVILTVTGVLTLLYGMLYLVVLRAKIIMKDQEVKLTNSLARIEADNRLLDERVSHTDKGIAGHQPHA